MKTSAKSHTRGRQEPSWGPAGTGRPDSRGSGTGRHQDLRAEKHQQNSEALPAQLQRRPEVRQDGKGRCCFLFIIPGLVPHGGCDLTPGHLGARAQGPAQSTALANGGPGHRRPWGSSPPRGERTWRGGSRPLELACSLWIGNLRVSSTEVAI